MLVEERRSRCKAVLLVGEDGKRICMCMCRI
jgi:hypothetical protein